MLAELGDVAVEVTPFTLGQADTHRDVLAEQLVRVYRGVLAEQVEFVLEQPAESFSAVHPVKQQHVLAQGRGHFDRAVFLGDGHGLILTPIKPVVKGISEDQQFRALRKSNKMQSYETGRAMRNGRDVVGNPVAIVFFWIGGTCV